MHKPSECPIDLPDGDIFVPVRGKHLAVASLPLCAPVTPLGPPGGLLGARRRLLIIDLLVGEISRRQEEALESRIQAVGFGLDPVDLLPETTEFGLNPASQLLLGRFLFRQKLAQLL